MMRVKPRKRLVRRTIKLHNLRLSTRLLIVVGLLTVSAATLYSAPPASKYMPGETLNPNCGPGDLNCSVEIGVGGGGSNWSTDGVDVWRSGGNVGVGTGSPSARLTVDGGSILVAGEMGEGEGITATGAGARMFFDMTKGAFRAGSVAGDAWDNSNVGHNSTAFGYNTTASGPFAVSFGYETEATHNFSTAFGYNTKANSTDGFATAFGSGTTASGWVSTAFGLNTLASGSRSVAWGQDSIASHDWSTAWGMGTEASGSWSTAWGQGSTASGDRSTAWGLDSVASGDRSTAFGHEVEALGVGSTAFGWNSTASGFASTAFGDSVVASGDRGVAFGQGSEASGDYSTAFGFNTVSSNTFSTALGFFTTASGLFSTALGTNTVASSFASTVLGSYNTLPLEDELQTPDSWILTDELFVIGNGLDNDNRSNALTILKNGDIGVGASAHLNWGTTIGAEGYGFRDNGGVMEFKDAGGNWIALNSLSGGGGGGESLWSLHTNGQDIYRNVGNVGVNTTNPTAQFESTSAAIAAWFRGVMGGGDSIASVTNTGRYELGDDSVCMVLSGHLSPDGTILHLLGLCQSETEGEVDVFVERHDLSTAWDVTTAESADIVYELGDEPLLDVTFSQDGSMMYVLGPDTSGVVHENMGAEVYQYDLSTPWDVSTASVSPVITRFDIDSIVEPFDIQLSSDGTKLFLSATYDNGEVLDSLLVYALNTPYDTSTLQEPPLDVVPGNGMQEYAFNNSGDRFFGLMPGADDGVVDIFEYALQDPWDLSPGNVIDSQAYESIDTNGLDVPYGYMYTDFLLRPEGSGFYLTYSALSPSDSPGISQYVGASELSGGTVLVDGNVGIGVETPTARLESISNTVAGWFRGMLGETPDPYDIDSAKHYYTLDAAEDCVVDAVSFTPDGLKVFALSYCYGDYIPTSTIIEYELGSAWDLKTAVPTGSSYNPIEFGFRATDITFGDDGTRLYVLHEDDDWGSGRISSYTLAVPWDISGSVAPDGEPTDLYDESVFIEHTKMKFNNDGTKLFVAGYAEYDFAVEGSRIYEYDLGTPWVVSTATYARKTENLASETYEGDYEEYIFPLDPFSFSHDGGEIFIMMGESIYDYSYGDEYNTIKINRFSLGENWSLENMAFVKTYLLGEAEEGAFRPYTDLVFSSDGLSMYVSEAFFGGGTSTHSTGGGMSIMVSAPAEGAGGIHQFLLESEISGGNVFVDGRLGVGTTSPTSKLTVIGNSEFHGDSSFNGNVNITERLTIGSGAPSAMLSVAGGSFLVEGGDNPEALVVSGEGTKMFFDARLGAFRSGLFYSSDLDEIGEYSVALGRRPIASGNRSIALGDRARAEGSGSVALGSSAIASGYYSLAFGSNIEAQADYGVVFGRYSRVEGIGGVAIGTDAYVYGNYGVALGSNVSVSANANYGTAFGRQAYVYGLNSTAFGFNVQAGGDFSTAYGSNAYAYGDYSVAFGSNVTAQGLNSTAFGSSTNADGDYSTAFGESTQASAYGSTVLGRYNVIQGDSNNWIPTDQLFVVGNGTDYLDRSNAFTVLKNGNIGLGDSVYLNFGTSDGVGMSETGYGFRDNAGVIEFKNSGGEWAPIGSGTGADLASPLWTLNADGNAIYNNGGGVGINTLNPGYQFEVVSNSVAARFRESLAPWDSSSIAEGGFHEVAGSCYVSSPGFNSNGTKMFVLEECDDVGEIVEYVLAVAWDVETATRVNSFDLTVDVSDSLHAMAVSGDGKRAFVMSSGDNDDEVQIHQFNIGTAWTVDSTSYIKSSPVTVNVGTLMTAGGFRFSRDGSSLYVLALMEGAIPGMPEGHLVEYELDSVWDIGSITEVANENFSVLTPPTLSMAQLFDFSSDGERLFVGTSDLTMMPPPNPVPYELTIREYSLSTPWSITDATEVGSNVLESGADAQNATRFTSFSFRPDGLMAYTGQMFSPSVTARVTQYDVGGGGSAGGSVIVDGSLSVGTDSPLYKFHVSTTGTGSVAGFTNENGTCTIDPNTSSLSCSSDASLKTVLSEGDEDYVAQDSSLSRIMQLKTATYRWNAEVGTDAPLRYGLIAQEVEGVFPELVRKNPDSTLAVSYGGFTPFFIDAIQELNTRIDMALLELVIDGRVGEEELDGSLSGIITRALKDAVLIVRELIAGRVQTDELCIGDTCFTADEAERLKELIEEDRDRASSNTPETTEKPSGETPAEPPTIEEPLDEDEPEEEELPHEPEAVEEDAPEDPDPIEDLEEETDNPEEEEVQAEGAD